MFILLVLLNPFLLDPIFDDPESETTLQHLESSISDAKIPQKINNIFSFEQQKFALSDEATDVMRNHFMGRLIAGANLKFTGPKREKRVVKINKGGDRCVVCYLDLCGRRNPDLIELIRRQLEWTGFNGHFYYRIGGFPAPHHYELKYAATPYSFKIFLMEEAHLLGFSKVLWIDSRMIPIRSIEPLFDKLKRKRCFFLKGSRMCHPNFLSLAIENLNKTLHIHPLNYTGIATGVFGLDFAYPPTRQFIQDYYTCAEN